MTVPRCQIQPKQLHHRDTEAQREFFKNCKQAASSRKRTDKGNGIVPRLRFAPLGMTILKVVLFLCVLCVLCGLLQLTANS